MTTVLADRLAATLVVAVLLAGCAGTPTSPSGAPEATASPEAAGTHEARTNEPSPARTDEPAATRTHEPASMSEAAQRTPTPAPSASTPAATKHPGLIGDDPGTAAAITAFSLVGPTDQAAIDQAAHTISLTVDACWANQVLVTGIAADFTTTGTSVSVGGVDQASGVTLETFKPRQTYTVMSADGSTQDYVVTVDLFRPMMGMWYQGGNIAYVLQQGDPGYEACHQHGIIAATTDVGSKMMWANTEGVGAGTGTPPGLPSALMTGRKNTDSIVAAIAAANGDPSRAAASVARSYAGGGYADWSLPSKDDLAKLYQVKAVIGGVTSDGYWSSTAYCGTGGAISDYGLCSAYQLNMGNGSDTFMPDNGLHNGRVRPVRYF